MRLIWALTFVLFAAPVAQAQDYPGRNVTFIVPTGPGAGTDLLARVLAPRLSDLPAKSVREFIALAKSKPGEFAYGTTGPGTPFHLYAELFGSMTGTQFVHVPYRAAVAAQVDLMGGRLQFMMTDFTSSLQLVREGKIRALGVTTKERAPAAPELVPIAELGVPGFEAAAWQMVVAPAATPKPVVDKLHAELKAIMATQEARQAIERIGLVPVSTGSPEEMQAFVRSEIVRWGEVVKRSGASVE
jgi:tripartite-type tricarboxylate transporter receptor subunit TctC